MDTGVTYIPGISSGAHADAKGNNKSSPEQDDPPFKNVGKLHVSWIEFFMSAPSLHQGCTGKTESAAASGGASGGAAELVFFRGI